MNLTDETSQEKTKHRTATAPVPQLIQSVSWLIGKWTSVHAAGFYPTIENFDYVEDVEFLCIGQPVLNYSAHSYTPDRKVPMHIESGFLRIDPKGDSKTDTNHHAALIIAHNFGIAEILEGRLSTNHLILESKDITRMSFTLPVTVVQTKREYTYDQTKDELTCDFYMATNKTPTLTHHLHAVYKRIAKH